MSSDNYFVVRSHPKIDGAFTYVFLLQPGASEISLESLTIPDGAIPMMLGSDDAVVWRKAKKGVILSLSEGQKRGANNILVIKVPQNAKK